MVISKEIISYSLRSIKHSKSRSLLTIFSIFVGIVTIFIFVSFGLGLVAYTEELKTSSSVNKINIQPKGVGPPGLDDTFALTEADLKAVEKTSGVFKASGVYFKPAEVKKNDVLKFVWAISYDAKNPLVIDLFDTEIYKGRQLRSGDNGRVVLGYNFLFDNKIFPRGLDINDKIEIQNKDFKVVGFYEPIGNPQDDSNIYMIDEDFEIVYEDLKGFNWIIGEVDLEKIDITIERVENNVRKSRNLEEGKEDFFVQSFQDLLEQFNTVLLFISVFVISIALISVVVSAINTANTMVTSTLERVKEIGVIKSIGAKNSEIFKIFLFESGFLGFTAGVLGVGIGFVVAYILSLVLENMGFGFLAPSYSFWLFFGLILFATATGAVSGAWPAWKASKVKPVDALRYE
jgi:putative ABC transport system permease protein